MVGKLTFIALYFSLHPGLGLHIQMITHVQLCLIIYDQNLFFKSNHPVLYEQQEIFKLPSIFLYLQHCFLFFFHLR